MLEFYHAKELIEIGEKAAHEVLPKIKEINKPAKMLLNKRYL